MTSEWHYMHCGELSGPVSLAELRRLAARGVLQPSDQVWKVGTAHWVQASTLKGLFPQFDIDFGSPGLPASIQRPSIVASAQSSSWLWSLIDNRIVHSLLAVCCFPVGLFLIWNSSLWSKSAKVAWTGCIALLFIAGALSPKDRSGHPHVDINSGDPKATAEIAVPVERVLKLRMGMTEREVEAILGAPHNTTKATFPDLSGLNHTGRSLISWYYNEGSDSWIVLLFEHGALLDGGTAGYSIKTGVIVSPELQKILDHN